jgi:hypothetical protein
MKYMMLIYWNQSETPQLTEEAQKAAAQEWYAFNNEAEAAGVLLEYGGLAPVTSATTVRVRDGKTLTTDGPFAETHEHLGGYYVFNCKDLDEALAWGAKIPAAKTGSIEIRPLWGQE